MYQLFSLKLQIYKQVSNIGTPSRIMQPAESREHCPAGAEQCSQKIVEPATDRPQQLAYDRYFIAFFSAKAAARLWASKAIGVAMNSDE